MSIKSTKGGGGGGGGRFWIRRGVKGLWEHYSGCVQGLRHEFQTITIKTISASDKNKDHKRKNRFEKKQKSKQNTPATSYNLAQRLLLDGLLCPIGNRLCQ